MSGVITRRSFTPAAQVCVCVWVGGGGGRGGGGQGANKRQAEGNLRAPVCHSEAAAEPPPGPPALTQVLVAVLKVHVADGDNDGVAVGAPAVAGRQTLHAKRTSECAATPPGQRPRQLPPTEAPRRRRRAAPTPTTTPHTHNGNTHAQRHCFSHSKSEGSFTFFFTRSSDACVSAGLCRVHEGEGRRRRASRSDQCTHCMAPVHAALECAAAPQCPALNHLWQHRSNAPPSGACAR